MGALAAELGFSCCRGQQLASTSEDVSIRTFSGTGIACAAIRLRSGVGGRHHCAVASSSGGRWLPVTRQPQWRVRGRGLDQEGGEWERGMSREGKVGLMRRSVAVHVVAVGQVGASKPSFLPLEQITGEAHFNQVLSEAMERNQPIVIDWLAQWCRKCIYLKPKLEKLAAEYHPFIKFYYVDVNKVPQALVKRAEVTKMPTIQLWKNDQKLAEVIGGHQGWLVMDEVREMIKRK